jgi:hypothetical protein
MLVELLEQEAVSFETLHTRYGSLLEVVRKLLGVVPNCDPYLEIWPPAFRTYNVMVPNLLNLPFPGWGLGAPRSTVGLAMYVSSRTAGCAYCSAHSCSFALRLGATVEVVASASTPSAPRPRLTERRCGSRALSRSCRPPSTTRLAPTCGASSPKRTRSG